MLWATRHGVNADLSIVPHLSRHPTLIGRSIVSSAVRVSRTRRGLTSPRWRRTRMTTSRGRGRPTRKGGPCHANLCDAGEMDRRGYPYRSPKRRQVFEDRITARGGKGKTPVSWGAATPDLRDL